MSTSHPLRFSDNSRGYTDCGAPTTLCLLQGAGSNTISIPLGTAASCLIHANVRLLHIPMTPNNDRYELEFVWDSRSTGKISSLKFRHDWGRAIAVLDET